MDQLYQVSITLDKRRPNKDGDFHVRIRVYDAMLRKQKLMKTPFAMNEDKFKAVWLSKKRKTKEYEEIYFKLISMLKKANDIASKLKPFDLALLEKKLYTRTTDRDDILVHFDEYAKIKRDAGKIKTADTYLYSKNSLVNYKSKDLKKDASKISFYEITADWLKGYEDYMVKKEGKSYSTVGIYLRNLRALFNSAIKQQEIPEVYYPFGKGKYQIPQSKGVKKALTRAQLVQLFNSNPISEFQQKAKDFWFLSFSCNGINIKDLAKLESKHIQGDNIIMYRTKTEESSKTNLKAINVTLTDMSKDLLKKYVDPDKKFILGIIAEEDSETEKQRKIDNFNRFINQHIKILAKENGLPEEISPYWARHTFATNAINQGASMEFVSEALSHNNLKTTQSYFSGFEDEAKKDIMNKLTDL